MNEWLHESQQHFCGVRVENKIKGGIIFEGLCQNRAQAQCGEFEPTSK